MKATSFSAPVLYNTSAVLYNTARDDLLFLTFVGAATQSGARDLSRASSPGWPRALPWDDTVAPKNCASKARNCGHAGMGGGQRGAVGDDLKRPNYRKKMRKESTFLLHLSSRIVLFSCQPNPPGELV